MPVIIKKQMQASVSVCLWQIQETEAFFLENYFFDPQDLLNIKKIKLESKRMEKWACRAALAELIHNNSVLITYTENGQPISQFGSISFSHTKDLALVVLSDQQIGVDIEQVTPKIVKLKHKFINQQEMNLFDAENPFDVTLIWCAKEAVFKWYENGNLDFSNEIVIYKNPLRAILKNEKEIPLFQMEYLDYMIVIATTI